jgi:endonuclease YncB( thermonuclease family)
MAPTLQALAVAAGEQAGHASGRSLSASLPARNQSPPPSRIVAAEEVAPPPINFEGLIREVPREPLGPLGQALPPPTPMPDEWEGTTLYRPVATSSAEFETMGYRLAIAGTATVPVTETCDYKGTQWQCGTQARSAVRMWLRGRALSCPVPPQPERFLIVVSCRFGKQDVGAWLVSNGWARAVEGGPYQLAGIKAREAEMGIFGPSPHDQAGPPAAAMPEENTRGSQAARVASER